MFVIGAGASLAEAQARRPVKTAEHPPLDKNFFQRVARYRRNEYRDNAGNPLYPKVQARARTLGEPDLAGTNPAVGLEDYLGRLYFNVQQNPLAASVRDYFTLVDLYAREVIGTTNWMIQTRPARKKELLRPMLQAELRRHNRVSIITFNIDLLIENTLEILAGSRPGSAWRLRDTYGFQNPFDTLTGSEADFEYQGTGSSEIQVYKMHGSVNWLFQTRDYYPPADLVSKPRKLYQITDKVLTTGRIYIQRPGARRWMLFPLIVPPVYEKHALIRTHLHEVWSNAEGALLSADRVLFWGYSFPLADTHARHFFQGLSHRNGALRSPVLVNPDPQSAAALWEVLRPNNVRHYRDAQAYLDDQ